MNISRRIYCNASNAFRPATALKTVFLEPSGRRLIRSQAGHDETASNVQVNPRKHFSNKIEGRWGQERKHASIYARQEPDSLGDEAEDTGRTLEERRVVAEIERNTPTDTNEEAHGPASVGDTVETRWQIFDKIKKKKLATQDQEVLEYDAKYVHPVTGSRIRATHLPWIQALSPEERGSPLSRLSEEVKSFADWMRATEEEVAAREALIEQTHAFIREMNVEFSVEPFGSSRNGLALGISDVDLRIYLAGGKDEGSRSWISGDASACPPKWETRKKNLSALYKLRNAFRNHPDFIFSEIRYSRYPLLHLQHKQSGYDLQIVCANDTSRQRARIAKYLDENPHLFDLYAFLKATLGVRGLTDVYKGGLGSYNILIMIIAALNKLEASKTTVSHHITEEPVEAELLGSDLLEVLKFYGQTLNTYKYVVSADPFEETPKLDPSNDLDIAKSTADASSLRIIDHTQPYLLCLIDPDDLSNDLGHKASAWKHIQETVRYLYRGLLQRLEGRHRDTVASISDRFVGAAYPTYQSRRMRAKAYGSMVLKEPEKVQERIKKSSKLAFQKLNSVTMQKSTKPRQFPGSKSINLQEVPEFAENAATKLQELQAENAVPDALNLNSSLQENELRDFEESRHKLEEPSLRDGEDTLEEKKVIASA